MCLLLFVGLFDFGFDIKEAGLCFFVISAVKLPSGFIKMEIEIDSENESRLKKIRKPPLLLSHEESLAKKVNKYLCLFDKSLPLPPKCPLPLPSGRQVEKG